MCNRVPSPNLDSIRKRSAHRLMFGRPMPAPKPRARTNSLAVEYPGVMARPMSGMPGPQSAASAENVRSETSNVMRPPMEWMMMLVSAS